MSTRTEKDSLGVKDIPAEVYYGIQTARAVENFPISGLHAHSALIRAIAMVKEAAAEANRELGLVEREKRERNYRRCQRNSRRQVERHVRGRCVSGWRGRQLPHEHQRGHRQPGVRAAGRQAGRVQARASQRSRQLWPVHQRRLPYRHASVGAAGIGAASTPLSMY